MSASTHRAPMPAPAHRAAKHRGPGEARVLGWTKWPKHRDATAAGPSASNGFEEDQRQRVAAMKLRAADNQRRRMAAWS